MHSQTTPPEKPHEGKSEKDNRADNSERTAENVSRRQSCARARNESQRARYAHREEGAGGLRRDARDVDRRCGQGAADIKGFSDKNTAIRFAQARAHGNVDHRVLRVPDQVLVVGTLNDL